MPMNAECFPPVAPISARRATRFVPYEAKDGYRWRLVGGNGRVMADSGEAYSRMRDCERAIRAVRKAIAGGA